MGRDIVAAFVRAAAMEVQATDCEGNTYDSRLKWIPEEYEKEWRNPTSGEVVACTGVRVVSHVFVRRRKYLLFGEMREWWSPNNSEASGPQEIRLRPLVNDGTYETLDIRLGRVLRGAMGYADGWTERFDADDVGLQDTLEKIVAEFLRQHGP